MSIVVLARHGRSTANSEGVLAGRMPDVHLDETGVEQAKAAGRRLAGVDVAAVATSPMERCRETARHLRLEIASRPPVRVDRRFSEVDYGDWTGKKLTSLAKESLWGVVQRHPSAAAFPGGESMAGMAARAAAAGRAFAATLDEQGPGAVGVAVSHGDVIKAILADALGMHLDLFQRIVVDPGSLSIVSYTAERPYVLAVNTHAGDLAEVLRPHRSKKGPRSPVGGSTGR